MAAKTTSLGPFYKKSEGGVATPDATPTPRSNMNIGPWVGEDMNSMDGPYGRFDPFSKLACATSAPSPLAKRKGRKRVAL